MRYHSSQDRLSWDEYFLSIAEATAGRSHATVPTGAVLVKDRHIRATGYSGPPDGYRGSDPNVVVPAETSCLLFAAPEHRDGATLYTTRMPSYEVAITIAASGVQEVVAASGRYEGWDATRDLLLDCGVRVRLLDGHDQALPLPL